LAALTNQIAGLARQKPMLMMLEDAHWLDPTSMEVFDLLIERIRGLPILLLITFRPEFRPRWSSLTNVTTLSLTRLGHAQCAAIVNRITGSKALPHKLLDHIIRKTDGVPLFVEELTRTILESELLQDSGGGYELIHPFSAVAIPSSLQDSLMARLDRLSGSREVAQIAACIGREFDYSLLYEVSNRRQDLNVALDQLEDSGLIFRKGIPPHAHYTFKHSLVQDVAYETLLKATRSLHHQRIAQVLESSSSELGTTDPELLAHHFWRAQLNDKAIHYGILAGRKAVTASGNLEAIDHFSRALELVKAQPESGQRDQQELDLLIALAVPMTSVKGYASTEVEKVYTRASQLCRRMGETPRLFPVLYGLWRFYLLSADYRMARDLGDQLLAMAHTFANPEFVLASNRAMGATLFYIGQLEEARNYLELVVATIPTADIRDSVLAYDVVDPWVASHAYNALSLWLLGYPDKARVEINKAISTAKEIGHPFSQALALCFATWTYQFCGDTARVGDLATEALILCKENSFQFWTGWAEILAAWAETRTLPAAACRERMKKGLIDWQATGSQLGLTYFQCLVAQAKPQDEASLQLNEAWIVAERTAEGFWQPEIQRLQGELHLGEPSLDLGQAEAFFTRALERARAMNARALELRICLSFARLFAKRNQSSRSLAMLENLLDWFSEGLDTSDLVEAHALRTAIRLEVAADPALKLMASG
jgi:predicted ATPase